MVTVAQYRPGLIQIRPQVRDSTSRIHENVCWYAGSFSGNLSAAQIDSISLTFGSAYEALWQPQGNPTATMIGATVTDWSSPNGLSGTHALVAIGLGSGEVPAQVSIVISQHGLTRYKGGHARIYLPSLAANVTTDGVNVAGASITSVNTNITALYNAMGAITNANGGPFFPQIFRQRTQVVPHTTPPTYQPAFLQLINTATCSPVLATQRRRLRKVPHH